MAIPFPCNGGAIIGLQAVSPCKLRSDRGCRSHPAPNVERPVFPVRLMISRFLSQTLRMRAMCVRLWERSTCVSTSLDIKGKGMSNFGCPPSNDRYCRTELTGHFKSRQSPPRKSRRKVSGGQGSATVLCLPSFLLGQADTQIDSAFDTGVGTDSEDRCRA